MKKVRQQLPVTDIYKFILFISGMSSKSIRAIENIQVINEKYLNNKLELEIIDISVEKQRATEFHIIAVPTLIKTMPAPTRIILGDLADIKKVLKILDLTE